MALRPFNRSFRDFLSRDLFPGIGQDQLQPNRVDDRILLTSELLKPWFATGVRIVEANQAAASVAGANTVTIPQTEPEPGWCMLPMFLTSDNPDAAARTVALEIAVGTNPADRWGRWSAATVRVYEISLATVAWRAWRVFPLFSGNIYQLVYAGMTGGPNIRTRFFGLTCPAELVNAQHLRNDCPPDL